MPFPLSFKGEASIPYDDLDQVLILFGDQLGHQGVWKYSISENEIIFEGNLLEMLRPYPLGWRFLNFISRGEIRLYKSDNKINLIYKIEYFRIVYFYATSICVILAYAVFGDAPNVFVVSGGFLGVVYLSVVISSMRKNFLSFIEYIINYKNTSEDYSK